MRRVRPPAAALVASLLFVLGTATPAASLSCPDIPQEEIALDSSIAFVGKLISVTRPINKGEFVTQGATFEISETFRGPKRDRMRVMFAFWCDGDCTFKDRLRKRLGASGLFTGSSMSPSRAYPDTRVTVSFCDLAVWDDWAGFRDLAASVRHAIAAERPN